MNLSLAGNKSTELSVNSNCIAMLLLIFLLMSVVSAPSQKIGSKHARYCFLFSFFQC